MKIEETNRAHCCDEHEANGWPHDPGCAKYLLKIGEHLVRLCWSCLKDLRAEIEPPEEYD
jgi:hypothetical protein